MTVAATLAAPWATAKRLLRGGPAHADAATARADARARKIAASAGTALAAKLIAVAVGLLTVPLTLHYLGPERYGMWLIMSSFVAILAFADMGIGNGLLNTVAAAYGREDTAAIKGAVSSGMAVLMGIAVAIGIGFAIAYPHVGWYRIFNAQTPLARAEAGPALAVFAGCFALAIPTGVVQRVQMALQQGYLANLWGVGGSVIALVGVVAAIVLQAGLPWLVLAFMGGPLIANAVNSLVFFGVSRRDIAPAPSAVQVAAAREVMRTGLLFLLLQVAAAITYNSTSIVIAQLLGAKAVAAYAVPERLFSLITMIVSMALQPLWPAYREAIVRGDTAWVRRTLRQSLIVAIGTATALSVPLMLLTPTILHYWVGNAIAPPLLLIVGFGVWKIIEAGGLALAMFLNGAHVVATQVVVSAATALISIGLTVIFIRTIGIGGAIWGTIIAFSVCVIGPYVVLVPTLLKRMTRGA